jgi:hypothetical protein
MPVIAVVGANWGDEGKGKVTDYLAREADFVVRYQGGNNAGHTIINEYGKFALHLLPSGVFNPRVVNVLGPGVAVNVTAFLAEIESIVERGVPRPDVRISERAQVLLPHHILFDSLEEERLAKESFGSTRSGIAPFYSDKYLKIGLQVNELFDEPLMRSRLSKAIVPKNVLLEKLYGKPVLSVDGIMAHVAGIRDRLAPYVTDTTTLLLDAGEAGKTILLEGQLGTLRDPDHGIYPYPTSSSPLAGFGSVGAGVPPWAITRVVAVTKAYSSCVGAGPFVTELQRPAGREGWGGSTASRHITAAGCRAPPRWPSRTSTSSATGIPSPSARRMSWTGSALRLSRCRVSWTRPSRSTSSFRAGRRTSHPRAGSRSCRHGPGSTCTSSNPGSAHKLNGSPSAHAGSRSFSGRKVRLVLSGVPASMKPPA